ncbi:NADPH:quinone reductase-like Zn-dependent oxidoreductase [Jatrophihabitans sp. GAS493]|uniref:quinone oxidoreductase family protein n=1 Tax=Jatrophihabitans sp. GAS493 TaxID=1907575 RepID=UPI000BB6A180|nr:quinone oxidoreductase [Jatrophihabitans sp. GAS493]SOD74286.1 NADPH:quinone reductase-like Zn-dependent oxidoreductase [Jatrophihabitans sp. GAS493]
MTEQTTAVVVSRPGGSEVLEVREIELAAPAPEQLRVQVCASGVNFVDVYQREGIYPIPTPFPLGMEGAGTVTAVGDAVTDIQVGDRVAWSTALGSHAAALNVNAADVVAVPDGLELEIAAAAMLQGMTAHYLATSTYPIQAGDTVLVHAAAGGVGQLLVQLASRRGARVIGVVSTDAKAQKATAAGADAVLRSELTADPAAFAAAVRDLNGGVGVQAVYDGVGAASFDASLASLRRRGTLAIFGAASGQVPPFDVQRLNWGGSLFVTRPTLADYVATAEEFRWRSGEILKALADGTLALEIGGRYPLADTSTAYDDLERRRSTGKLIITR